MAWDVGTAGSVTIGTTATVAEVTNWAADFAFGAAEHRPLGTRWTKRKITSADVTGSFDAAFDGTDTNGQVALVNSALAGSIVWLRLYTGGTNYYNGSAVITGQGASASNDEKTTRTFSFSGEGSTWSYT